MLEIQHRGQYDSEALAETRYPIEETQRAILFLLDLESTHFFSLNKDEQLELITTFLRASLDDAQEARIGEIEATQSEEE